METPGLDLYQDDPLLPTLILLTVCLRIVPRFSLAVFWFPPSVLMAVTQIGSCRCRRQRPISSLSLCNELLDLTARWSEQIFLLVSSLLPSAFGNLPW